MSDTLSALLDRVGEVCPLPTTTHRVMELMNSERSNIGDVAKVISTDPALAAAVLRIANSAIFGSGKVDRLDNAILRIGFRGLRESVGAMSLLAAFRSQAELQLQLHDLSVVAGSIANRLAKELGTVVPATAFTCGLLSEIGAMVCIAVDGKQYVPIWTETSRTPLQRMERERARYSVTSFEIGRRFLERNKLPETMGEAVGSELGTSVNSLQPLDQITLLARHASPIVLGAALEGGVEQTIDELADLAQKVGLTTLDGKAVLEICVQAGVLAESSLKEAR
jgi:HD-like signal output (HDOD) protein